MKSILLFVLVLLLQQASAQVPEKYALIVAISNYAPSTGWNKLNSENDIPLIKESLKRQGFKEENIRIMRDKEGTKTGILTAMQQQFLGKAKAGDICVFHFSGHGQQVMDDNGDEADGYDEALVTYDSPMDYEPGVEKHQPGDQARRENRHHRPQRFGQEFPGQTAGRPLPAGRRCLAGGRRGHSADRRQRIAPQHRLRSARYPAAGRHPA